MNVSNKPEDNFRSEVLFKPTTPSHDNVSHGVKEEMRRTLPSV